MKYKKILITGAAGFIGTNLCKKILENSDVEIIALDNLYTGTIENLNFVKKNKNFEFINHDVRNSFDINCDLIINLACPASPIHYQKDKVFTAETSVLGAMNVCKNSLKYDSDIIHASTSEIYGDPLIHPQNEGYFGNVNINGIRSCYDEGKRFSETYIGDFCDKFDINFKILRIFNTYGSFMNKNDGRVISNFINQAINGDNITIYGDGKQTRSICYVDDLINGILDISKLKERGIIVNIGNNNEVTILQIAEKIIELTQSKSKIIFEQLPQDDPKRRKPDLTKIKALIDWENLTPIEEGLMKTINYFSNK